MAFDKCLVLCIHHYSIEQNCSVALENSVHHLFNTLPLWNLWKVLVWVLLLLFYHPYFCLFQNFIKMESHSM